jgi:hypothetical protein
VADFIGLLRDIRDVKYPEIVAKHNEVITKSEALIIEIAESEALLNTAIAGAQQVASDKEEVRELSNLVGNNTVAVTAMKTAIDVTHADVLIKERSVNDAYTGLLSNLTSINQSIAAANVIKHDLEASTLAAADVNYYLMSTITKADNAQNALDLKVQQNLVALNDIVNDNVMTLETKAQAAGDMIDLKIAMAVQARNDLSIIEQSVLIATASADKAALAYENIKDTKALIDAVMSDAESLAQTLGDLSAQATPLSEMLNGASTAADASKIAIDASIVTAQGQYDALQVIIAQATALGMEALVAEATEQASRLEVVIPVAQNLSAETEAAITAAQNVSQATTLGNTLLNLINTSNTQASEYINTINATLATTVEQKVDEVLETVVSAKIDQIADTGNTLLSQLDTASTEAQALIDAIYTSAADADISALEA